MACPREARSKQSPSTVWNFFSSGITWSAGNTAMTPVVERAPTMAAPSVTAAQVSRPTGSATTFSFGNFGNCLRTSGACTSLVMTKMFSLGTSGATRATACWRKDVSPRSLMSCLGVCSRLTGQKRAPRPPAMMMTKRSRDWAVVGAFISGQKLILKQPARPSSGRWRVDQETVLPTSKLAKGLFVKPPAAGREELTVTGRPASLGALAGEGSAPWMTGRAIGSWCSAP